MIKSRDMSFWEELKKKGPILGLSPMDGVTDVPFRYMVAKYGHPDVEFSEFVSVDALYHAKGKSSWEKVIRPFIRIADIEKDRQRSDLCVSPYEVAQVFGKEPELFEEAAELIVKMGFDGIDINMGCPAGKVYEHGSGAGLITTPEVAQRIVKATQAGILRGRTSKLLVPVSVKTRLGVSDTHEMEEWIEALMEVKPVVVSLHGRTLRQMYTGKADWKMIARAAEIVHKRGGIILGNGDVKSKEEALEKVRQYGVDGVLIGRASFGNPGIFGESSDHSPKGAQGSELDKNQRLEWMVEHAKKYEEIFGREHFVPMRKHLAWYAKGFAGASELRQCLVLTNSAKEVEKAVLRYS